MMGHNHTGVLLGVLECTYCKKCSTVHAYGSAFRQRSSIDDSLQYVLHNINREIDCLSVAWTTKFIHKICRKWR